MKFINCETLSPGLMRSNVLICVYKNKLLAICFSLNLQTPPDNTQSPPSLKLLWENIVFHKVVLNVLFESSDSWAFSYDHAVHNFVTLTRALTSWRLFVTTSRKDIELLMHNDVVLCMIGVWYYLHTYISTWISYDVFPLPGAPFTNMD